MQLSRATIKDVASHAGVSFKTVSYVLNGGEVAVLAMTEAIVRLLPGVVGNAGSLVEESHEGGLLEYPVYTKPAAWRGREVPDVLLSGDHKRIAAWRRAEAEQPEHTILVNLQRSEDELLSNLHHMARRNVRKSAKLGVTAGRDDDFEAFWDIFTATNARAQLGAFPRAYYEAMLCEGNKYGGEAYIVLARHEGRALAGGFFLAMGGGVYYLYGGSVKDDRPTEGGEPRKDVQAPTAFYWGAMMDAKRRGYRLFDFWGIPRTLDEGKHSFGVFKMKENFGGEKVWYPGYEFALSPLAPAVTRALRLRKSLNNYRRRGSAQDVL